MHITLRSSSVEAGGIAVLLQPAKQARARLGRTTLLHVMVRDGHAGVFRLI